MTTEPTITKREELVRYVVQSASDGTTDWRDEYEAEFADLEDAKKEAWHLYKYHYNLFDTPARDVRVVCRRVVTTDEVVWG